MLSVIHFNHTPKPLSNPSFEHYSNYTVTKIAKKIYKDCSWQSKVARLTIKNHRYPRTGTSSPPPNDASVVGSHYATASKCALRTSRCRLQLVHLTFDLEWYSFTYGKFHYQSLHKIYSVLWLFTLITTASIRPP